MNFNEVATQVIKDSVRSAICIDDKYAPAYYDGVEDLIKDEPRLLYNSFREKGHCDLDIYNFKSLSESWHTDYMLANKDMMILDWELDQNAVPKYNDTLQILADVINSDQIPFVVIYTATEDTNEVGKELIKHFNISYDKHELSGKINQCLVPICDVKEIDEIEIELFTDDPDVQQLLYDYIVNFHKGGDSIEALEKDIYTKIEERLPLKDKITGNAVCSKIYKELNKYVSSKNRMMSDLALIALSENADTSSQYKICRVESDDLIFKINGTTVLVYHKKDKENGIKPSNLFDKFSQAIVSNPHNYLSLLSLELKDQLREEFSKIGTRFSEIDETAFFYHMQNFRKDNNFDTRRIYDFVLKSWLQDLSNHKLDGKSKVIDKLKERYESIKETIPTVLDNELTKELIKYSALISTSNVERSDPKIRFGDIFFSSELKDYFLCITPHCDCERPEKKINNNFYFVRGKKKTGNTPIEEAEQGFYSYINIENNAICIEWITKPFTSYIANNNYNSAKIQFKDVKYDTNYITTLKENFAQRISNESFGYGFRVGIDLPHKAQNKS